MEAFYFKLLARSQGNLSGVHEDLRSLYSLMVERCPDGLFPCVVEGVRSRERQAELRRAGLSWVRQSLHQTGRAIDVVLFKVSEAGIQATYDPADYGRFATACRLPRSMPARLSPLGASRCAYRAGSPRRGGRGGESLRSTESPAKAGLFFARPTGRASAYPRRRRGYLRRLHK